MTYIFALVILVIQGLISFGHFIVYKFLVSVFDISNQNTPWYIKLSLVCLALSFVIASLLAFKFYNPAVRWFYILSAVWLGILFYLVLAAVGYWLSVIISNWGLVSLSSIVVGKILLIIALITSAWGVVNANIIKVSSFNIDLGIKSEFWQGKKAVWVSDIHLGHVRGIKFLERVVKQINKLEPDIIFIGGDLYDGTIFPLETSIEPLKKLIAPQGIYFITGNHEEFGNNLQYLENIKKSGIKVLNNELVEINGLQLAGVDYKDSTKKVKLAQIISSFDLKQSQPSIILIHAPFHLEIVSQQGFNVLLAGHTHRAQMWPLNFITQLIYKGYDFGLKKYDNMVVYTSSGVGTWGPPLKIGNPAEIVLISFDYTN